MKMDNAAAHAAPLIPYNGIKIKFEEMVSKASKAMDVRPNRKYFEFKIISVFTPEAMSINRARAMKNTTYFPCRYTSVLGMIKKIESMLHQMMRNKNDPTMS